MKLEIAKKRSEGAKIHIEYNNDGDGVGEGYVQLVSYLGVLARTMVSVYHTDWRVHGSYSIKGEIMGLC